MTSEHSTWPPDDRIRRAFAETAKAYDDIARRNFRRIALDLIAALQVERSQAVLDVACGSGLVGALMRERGLGSPLGVDISAAMLLLADGPRILGDATALPLKDERFDIAICSLGLQMLEDPDVGLLEMHRVLAPRGRIGVSMWGEESSTGELDAAVRDVLDGLAAGQPGHQDVALQVPQVVISSEADLGEAFSDCGFAESRVWTRTKRTAFRGPEHYFSMLAVFPGTWIRLDRLGDEAEVARTQAVEAIAEVAGGTGPFEVTEDILMGTAVKP